MMYATLKNGKRMPIRTISSACRNMFFLRKPGRPSYQIDASSCCTLGCATNWKYPGNAILTDGFRSRERWEVASLSQSQFKLQSPLKLIVPNYNIKLTNVLCLFCLIKLDCRRVSNISECGYSVLRANSDDFYALCADFK